MKQTISPMNEEAVRAWDTVLFERFKRYRHIFVGALTEFSEEALASDPPARGDRCIDIGCGFGDTTQRLAEIAGPEGRAHGVDSSSRFIEMARSEARTAQVENLDFEVADAQAASWDGSFDYAFSRMGTMFFANPVVAMRAIRGALRPSGRLCMIVWRRKVENPFMHEAELVVERFLSHPDASEADTCGPGPFSMGNSETTTGILEAAGFDQVRCRRVDREYLMGHSLEEAVEVITALGPAAELIRVNGAEGERRLPEITAALNERLADWTREDGSVVGEASVWIVTATNPGGA